MAATYHADRLYSHGPTSSATAAGGIPAPSRGPTEDSESNVEEIRRDFPPAAGGAYYERYRPEPPAPPPMYDRDPRRRPMRQDMDWSRRSRSVGYGSGGGQRRGATGRRQGPGYGDDDYYYVRDVDYRRSRPRGHRRSSYSDDAVSSSSSSRSPSPRRHRRKSLGEQAVGALGSAAGALGLKSRSRSRHQSRQGNRRYDGDDRRHYGRSSRRGSSRSSSSDRSGRRHHGSRSRTRQELTNSLAAAVTAGAAEAYHARREPGGWGGAKGKRVMTAALGAGGVDGLLEHYSSEQKPHDKRHFIESAIAGLATNRLLNGPRSGSRGRYGRRTRSESHGGFKKLASAGTLAAVGKEAYNHYQRSKSRGRQNRGSRSSSSDEGGSDDGRGRHQRGRRGSSKKRSHSVSAYLNRGLSALGLADDDDRGHRRGRHHRSRGRYHSPTSSDADDYSEDDYSYASSRGPSGGRHSRRQYRSPGYRQVSGPWPPSHDRAQSASPAPRRRRNSSGAARGFSDSGSDQDTDDGSSTDDERTRKRLNRRRIVSTGLASLSTLHAAHEMAQNATKRRKRNQELKAGIISHDEARRMRRKGNLKDLASLGLMGLGLKEAASEWKEVAKHHHECREFQNKCKERARRRSMRSMELEN